MERAYTAFLDLVCFFTQLRISIVIRHMPVPVLPTDNMHVLLTSVCVVIERLYLLPQHPAPYVRDQHIASATCARQNGNNN